MDKQDFYRTLKNVQKTIFWNGILDKKDRKYLERRDGFKFLSQSEFEDHITKLKNFNCNLLWDKSWLGLSISDSICAVSSEPSAFLDRIRNGKYDGFKVETPAS